MPVGADAPRLFSDRYAWLVAGATRDPDARWGYGTGPDAPTLTERLLQCIWYDQLLQPDALRTRDGAPVRVVAPGFWNFEAGPDFRRAELQIGPAPPVRGDVEVHLRPEDWPAHGHHRDARYNGTLLHVVLHDRADAEATHTAAGSVVPRLAIADALVDRLEALRDRLDTADYPYASALNVGQCCRAGLTGTAEAYWRLIALAGEARLLLKAQRAAALSDDRDHGCYAMVLQALGYKAFAAPCADLAQRVPYAKLRRIARHAGSDAARTLEATLLGAAGLLAAEAGAGGDAAARKRLGTLQQGWAAVRDQYALAPMAPERWRAPHVRPANRPARRLAAAAHLLAATSGPGLACALRDCVDNARPLRDAWRSLEAVLTVEGDGFWTHRGDVLSPPWARKVRLVGPSRARVLAIDAAVPALLAWARATDDHAFQGRLHALVSAAPAQSSNAKLRLALYRMHGAPTAWPRRVRTALHGQGLLHVLQEWCLERPSCEGCGVWRVLAERPGATKEKGQGTR